MKKIIKTFVMMTSICLSLILFLSFSIRAISAEVEPLKSLADLQHTMKNLQTKTNVRVGVPNKLPSYVFLEDNSHYIRSNVEPNFYGIGITFDSDCDGSEYCEHTTFLGSSSPIGGEGYKKSKSTAITLKNGDKAIFYDQICGASCTHSQLVWKHDEFYYVIDQASGDMKSALDVANTMSYSVKNPKKPRK